MLNWKKWVAALTGAAAALSLAGCTLTTPATVLQVDGTDIPAGLYLAYQMQAYDNAVSQLGDASLVKDGEIEDMPAEEWIHAQTLEGVRRYVWVENAFEAQGLSFTEEESDAADTQIESVYSQNEELMAANGIGLENYRRFQLCEAKYQKLLTAYIEAESDSISDAEAQTYMNEHYAKMQLVMCPTTDADGNTLDDDKMETLNGYAEDLMTAAASGESLEALAPAYLEKVYALCGREYSEDVLSTYLTEDFVSLDGSSSYYPQELVQQIIDTDVGSTGIYTSYGMPMVYQKLENFADDTEFSLYASSIVSQILTERFDAQIEQEAAALSLTEDADAVKTYSISKIKESV